MIEFGRYFSDWWNKNDPAPDALISNLASGFLRDAPGSYLEFLKWGSGGEGFTGSVYLTLWSANDLQKLNCMYEVQNFFPDSVAIGDDGPNAILFHGSGDVRIVPFGDKSEGMLVRMAECFEEFVERARTPELWSQAHRFSPPLGYLSMIYRVQRDRPLSKQAVSLSRVLSGASNVSSKEVLLELRKRGEYVVRDIEHTRAMKVLVAAEKEGIALDVIGETLANRGFARSSSFGVVNRHQGLYEMLIGLSVCVGRWH